MTGLLRDRLIVALVFACALAGCVANDGQPQPVVDTRMPVVVDYYAHQTKNPPAPRPSGPVGPVDDEPGRSRDFGPETRAIFAPPSTLVATLDAFRATEPKTSRAWLGLAKSHKSKPTETARTDWLGGDDPSIGGPRDVDAPDPGPAPRGISNLDGGYRLNFADADISDVMQAVLGHVLNLNYTIAPNVTGHITISSSAPQSKSELLSTVETVLSLQGLSLTKSGGTYRVAPLALGGGTIDQTGREPGFGISVVPVQYTSVASMTKLLSGFVTDGDGLRIDTAHNAVIVRGPGPRREEIVRAIKAFDGDWMHQQSVSMFELKRSRPEEVVAELTRIFNADTNGDSAGVIQFKPVKRLRSIMVISRNDVLIRRAGAWIRRLDHQDISATSSIFVYRPQYRDARELTRLVNGLFGQGQGQSQGQNDNTPGVNYQQQGQGSNRNASSSSGSQSLGTSSASYAGGLTSNASFGGGGGGGLGGNSGAGQQQSAWQGNTAAGSGSGGGLDGSLADPIEAGDSQNNKSMHMSLSADTSNNTIVAYTDGETYAKVQSVLKQLDVPPLQVAINVVIAEVQLNDELKYGIQFYLNSHKTLGSISLADAASSSTSALASKLPGFNFLVGNAATPDVVISALDAISKVHILSTPSLVVMENKPATLEVGNQVPVTTQSAQSNISPDAPTVNSVTYMDTGIILKIIPRVGQRGIVAMDIDQVISSVVPDATGANNLTPTISKRRITSAIAVQSGQNVLLAGLINDTRQQSKGQVPFLGGGLGDVFGNKDNAFSRTELVVFIRPVIVRSTEDAQQVAEDFRSKLNAMNLRPPPVYK